MQIYVSDCYEWRIANLNMLKLPRYSASVATAASMYHGKKVTTEGLNTTTRLVNLSAEHDRDCLLDFSRPRLIVSMGRFTADARDRHKASLPANVERSANLASRSPSHPSLRYIKPSQGLLASEMFLCNDKLSDYTSTRRWPTHRQRTSSSPKDLVRYQAACGMVRPSLLL